MQSIEKLTKSGPRVDNVDAARFEGEGGRLADEPEIRHFCDESWCDLPRHESHGHDLPSHWSEYVVDTNGFIARTEDEFVEEDPNWAVRIADPPRSS